MKKWPSTRIQDLLGIELPIIQAPMAGADSPELAAEVSEAGGLGSLACPLLTHDQIRESLTEIRKRTSKPFNLNFFSHRSPQSNPSHEKNWLAHLKKFHLELGLDVDALPSGPTRAPFDENFCALVEELRPKIVSFHFGLPDQALVQRLKKAGILILSSATSVQEARWLEDRGCDAIIAQGSEAGGHRGMFLNTDIATQVGTMALVPQIVDAVKVPVIAAGGIADSRGIAASFALGASAVQLGTAYLFCPEAHVSPLYREALRNVRDDQTALTNIFSGRAARGIVNRFVNEVGPMSALAPEFPLASSAVAPLRKKSEAQGSTDFMQMWAGQSAHLCREMPAGQLTRILAEETLSRII